MCRAGLSNRFCLCQSVSQSVSQSKAVPKISEVRSTNCNYNYVQIRMECTDGLITESMHGVAVPPTLYGQYNVFVQKEALSERPNSPRGTYSSNTLVVCAIRPLTQHSFSPSNSTTCTIPPLLPVTQGV